MKKIILLITILSFTSLGAVEMNEAYFAGGCFWGVEKLFKKVDGVSEIHVGYMGGKTSLPTYKDITTGQTGHAEAVRITYDSKKVSYRELLKYFFRIHDPTTLNQQKGDKGTQYRSAIFTSDESEINEISDVIKNLEKYKVFKDKVVTSTEALKVFYLAEDYHQDYLTKNPNGYQCHLLGPELPFK